MTKRNIQSNIWWPVDKKEIHRPRPKLAKMLINIFWFFCWSIKMSIEILLINKICIFTINSCKGGPPPRGSAAQFFGRPFWTLNPKVPVAMRVVADHQIILIMSKPMLMWKHLTIGCPSHTWHHPKPAPVGSPDVLWPVSEMSQEKSFTASAQSNSSCCQNQKFKSASPRNEKKIHWIHIRWSDIDFEHNSMSSFDVATQPIK